MFIFNNIKIQKAAKNRLIFVDNNNTKRSVYYGGLSADKISKILGKEPNSIIEFGSYDGGDGLKYKLEFPNSLVVSIEACPDLFKKLSFLEFFGIKVFHYLISDKDGEAIFHQAAIAKNPKEKSPTGSELTATKFVKELNPHVIYEENSIKVPAITLETLIYKILKIHTVDILHIDTQGTFIKVLKGLGKIKPSLIFAEIGMKDRYHGADSVEDSDNIMKEMGYKKISQHGLDATYLYKNNLN